MVYVLVAHKSLVMQAVTPSMVLYAVVMSMIILRTTGAWLLTTRIANR